MSEETEKPKRRLRLLKVAVQATWVIDNGETLEERPSSAVVILPSEWPTYATERFATEAKALQEALDNE